MRILKESKVRDVQLIEHDDGRYQVMAGNKVVAETRAGGYAELLYTEAMDERDTGKAVREAERAHYATQAARSESFARRAANARKTGGRGGRGGV